MARVLFVCLGNICRSPMAEGILRGRAVSHGWSIDSAGTAGHHVGEGADPRTERTLARHGQSFSHAARRVTLDDFTRFDHIVAMDQANLADLRRLCPATSQHKLALALEPLGGGDVPDPYYGEMDGFEHIHTLLTDAIDAWIPAWSSS